MTAKSESDHGHGHGVTANGDQRYLAGALTLIVGFMAVEVIIGVVAGSLALISDAGHMLTDAVAIGLALVAIRLAARPPRRRRYLTIPTLMIKGGSDYCDEARSSARLDH